MSSKVGGGTEAPEIIDATEGVGPLLQRDYYAVIEGTDRTPEQVGTMLRERFETFAPSETATFERSERCGRLLGVGDDLGIQLALLGECRVRVVHHDACSLTLRTLEGHPEAGRITFGAGRDERGRLTFRINSRTRASRLVNYLGYLVMGKQLQSRCWIRFIDRLAHEVGGKVAGRIRVRTWKVEEEPGDRKGEDLPTFGCNERGGD